MHFKAWKSFADGRSELVFDSRTSASAIEVPADYSRIPHADGTVEYYPAGVGPSDFCRKDFVLFQEVHQEATVLPVTGIWVRTNGDRLQVKIERVSASRALVRTFFKNGEEKTQWVAIGRVFVPLAGESLPLTSFLARSSTSPQNVE